MAIIVFDDFNRADNPSSLGTATTGQVWQPFGPGGAGDTHWEIKSSNAGRFVDSWGNGHAVIESGVTDAVISVTIVNASAGGNLNNSNFGITFRWVDTNNYCIATWSRNAQFLRFCVVHSGIQDCSNEGAFGPIQIQDGDVIKIALCGNMVQGYLNDVLQVELDLEDFVPSPSDLPMGTLHGLQCGGGVITPLEYTLFDDFTVETNTECAGVVTYNCTVDGCVDPGDGTGTYATLEECEAACGVVPSWNCVDGVCVDPGDGTGVFDTLEECQASGCEAVPSGDTATKRFDAGTGNADWWILPQLSDSGVELRDKTIKAVRITGKVTEASFEVYGYGATEELDIASMIAGTNSRTGAVAIPDTTGVESTQRFQVRVPRSALHTVRVEGTWDGEGIKDRIDEIEYEIAEQGVRR